jgi:hypothetical protein
MSSSPRGASAHPPGAALGGVMERPFEVDDHALVDLASARLL